MRRAPASTMGCPLRPRLGSDAGTAAPACPRGQRRSLRAYGQHNVLRCRGLLGSKPPLGRGADPDGSYASPARLRPYRRPLSHRIHGVIAADWERDGDDTAEDGVSCARPGLL